MFILCDAVAVDSKVQKAFSSSSYDAALQA